MKFLRIRVSAKDSRILRQLPAKNDRDRFQRRLRFAALLIASTFVTNATAATYFIDYASGSNANNGTATNTPWKFAPGMNGFAGSYTHAAGDRFIFKGGTTWPTNIAVWNITSSGTLGTNDYYGVDTNWFSGASWSRPVFDGGSQYPIPRSWTHGYWVISGSYITMDSLTLQNIGVAGTNQGNYAIKISGHDITVENMKLAVQSRIAFMLNFTGGNNYTFRSNDISKCSWGIGGGPAVGVSVTNIFIYGNSFHDFHDQMANDAHGDGIYIYSSVTNLNTYCDNVRIYNNSFYGDFSKADASATGMSAFIWPSAQAAGSSYIYNNVMTYDKNGGGVANAISVGGAPGGTGTAYILNNSFCADKHSYYFVGSGNMSNLIALNNVAVGNSAIYAMAYPQSPVGKLQSDFNDYFGQNSAIFNHSHDDFKSHTGPVSSIAVRTAGTGYTNGTTVYIEPNYGMGALAEVTSVDGSGGVTALTLTSSGWGFIHNWPGTTSVKTGKGSGLTVAAIVSEKEEFELHGISNNPFFASNDDLRVHADSPIMGAGTNLTKLAATLGITELTKDFLGRLRPATDAWDIGAYADPVGDTNSALLPPKGLQIRE